MTSNLLNGEGNQNLFQKRDLSDSLNSYNQDGLDPNKSAMMTSSGAMLKSKDKESALDNVNKGNLGLWSMRAMVFVFLWYFFSALTLFLNKYILATMHGDPVLLSTMQMILTAAWGYLQMHYPLGMASSYKYEGPKQATFYKNMLLVGSLRFSTVFLGLVALKFVAVSFTETVKSSAPIFTVLISRFVLHELTGFYTQLSLVPIMGGLALCSAYELSFNIPGFLAALFTNLSECLQFVFAKLLISGYKCSPAETQFYTSVASMVVQIPTCIFLMDVPYVIKTMDMKLLLVYLMNGTFFHFQSMAAWVLMEYVSPVTHSVVNVVKRAFLIWISVLLFGNPVTFLSGMGTIVVTAGVLLYNKAKTIDTKRAEQLEKIKDGRVTNV